MLRRWTRRVLSRPTSRQPQPGRSARSVLPLKATNAGIDMPGACVHSLRATAATNALEHDADIAKVKEWLGHANVSTTRVYDQRRSRTEDSPTFRVEY